MRGRPEAPRMVRPLHEREQIAETGRGKDKIAFVIRLVQFYNMLVAGQPCKHRLRMRNFTVKISHRETRQKRRAVGHPAGMGNRIRKLYASLGQGVWPDRAAQDAAAELLAILRQIQPCQQRTHGMPEQEIRHAGITLLHDIGELLHIVDQVLPSILRRKKTEFGFARDRRAVAKMVVSADDKSQAAQVFCKNCIPGKVFAHPVRDLNDAAGLHAFWRQNIIGD